MLKGEIIQLRPVREADLDRFYELHQALENRGPYYAEGVYSASAFRRKFHETGFWGDSEGTLLIVTPEDEMIGHIEFFRTAPYLDELEIAYMIYSDAQRGRGAMTEALRLLTGYLFSAKKYNRLRLMILPENDASKRVAEKCGFRRESLARDIWFQRGKSRDVEVYALLRAEYEAARKAGT